MEPISQYYYSHRLKIHFWDWGDNGKPTPYGFNMEDAQEVWWHITCPRPLFRGLDCWVVDPESDGRIKAVRDYCLVSVPPAGHWVQHDPPEVFIEKTPRFLMT